MERPEPYINEEQAKTLVEAFRIIRKAFPDEAAEDLLELLELCRKNDGLLVAPRSEMVMGYFRYNPGQKIGERKMIDIVKDYDFETLKLLDLRNGIVVHIVGFASPLGGGFGAMRPILHALNARAVSTHRIKNGERYFALRKNVRFREANYGA